jgi:hypothetical protein
LFSIDSNQFYSLLGEYTGARDEFSKKIELINTNIPKFMSEVDRFLEDNPEIKNLLEEDEKLTDNIDEQSNEQEDTQDNTGYIESEPDQEVSNLDQVIPIGEVQEVITDIIDLEREKKLRDIYRKIVKITHPDKTLDQILHELYIQATGYYNEKDLLSLFYLCYKLGISFTVDSVEVEELNEKTSDFRSKNKFLDNNLTLVWLYSDKKERVILDYILSQIRGKRMNRMFV